MAGEAWVRRFESSSPEATEAFGLSLGQLLAAGDVVALIGELGSGKTCLTRGLARGVGVEEPVTSPTYTLMQSYAGRVEFWHLDAYLEGRERAFLLDGAAESLGRDQVAVIEWADRVLDLLPARRLELELVHLGPETRGLELRVAPEAGAALCSRLAGWIPPEGVLEVKSD